METDFMAVGIIIGVFIVFLGALALFIIKDLLSGFVCGLIEEDYWVRDALKDLIDEGIEKRRK